MPKLFVGVVDEAARQQTTLVFAKTFKTAGAKLGDEANVRGGAAWAEVTLSAEPAVLI